MYYDDDDQYCKILEIVEDLVSILVFFFSISFFSSVKFDDWNKVGLSNNVRDK